MVAATVSDDELALRLSPPSSAAPASWQVRDEGRVWAIAASDVGRPRRAVAPFPGLVTLGRDAEGRDVLVDLEAARGPIAVTGDPTGAREVATAIAVELAHNGWSDALRMVASTCPRGSGPWTAARVRSAPTVRSSCRGSPSVGPRPWAVASSRTAARGQKRAPRCRSTLVVCARWAAGRADALVELARGTLRRRWAW